MFFFLLPNELFGQAPDLGVTSSFALIYINAPARTSKADRLFKQWDYLRAAELYEKEASENPNADVFFKLGECYRILKQYKKEEQAAYDKVNEAGIYSNSEFYLNYGLVLRANGNYYQAKAAFRKRSELMPSDLRGEFFSNSIELVIDDQKWDEPITITNVSTLNTVYADFSPVFYKEGIVFTSSRETACQEKIYGRMGVAYNDLYYANKGSNNIDFTDVVPFLKNNKEYNDGPASFSANFDTLYVSGVKTYLTDNRRKKNKTGENRILISTNKNGQWTEPTLFAFNSDNFSVAFPYLAPNGSRLFFVSNMPGGYGETDIYYCNREGNKWGNPINMGPNINTFNREKFPYIDSKGNFYFSSDGYQGFGGMDICIALNNNGTLEKAKPMKHPFNSYFDDYGILFIEDEKTGYFTSNRKDGGVGDDDIYYFDLERDQLVNDLSASAYTIGYRPTPRDKGVRFLVHSPKNIPDKRLVRETFPLRNYIFFDLGSTEIPDRYVLLTRDQVHEFKETQLENFTPSKPTSRSKRQMTAYYNILNIVGDRLEENPSSGITLVGSSEKGAEDGKAMAKSVKKYLTDIFLIDGSRIGIEGRSKPKIPSEQPGGKLELELLRQGDRRVSIESSSPAMLMEFQSGSDALLKEVEIIDVQEAPLESYVSFNAIGATETFSSWSLNISDTTGTVQHLGPYTREKVSIPGKFLLGSQTSGKYKVTMCGKTNSGHTVTMDTTIQIVLWTKNIIEKGMRFSVLFEFDFSKSITLYERYLTNIVTPKIPENATLFIHGYADVIGETDKNLSLSLARATDVSNIIKRALANTGRNDVKFKILGFGEDQALTPFANILPEERFYNRTVIIDIIPK
ncbi:MAG: PD40 domain-containing protein [Prolixibacteraceae bacterium]|nr:PD40 domain-containing protein [Prolixibacteraceae bacterium]